MIRSDIMYERNDFDTIICRITGFFTIILIFGIILVVFDNLFHMSKLLFYTIIFSNIAIAIIVIVITIGVIIQKRF
jgi:hypothetical protein